MLLPAIVYQTTISRQSEANLKENGLLPGGTWKAILGGPIFQRQVPSQATGCSLG